MALNSNSLDKLNKELSNPKNLKGLFKDIVLANRINTLKILKSTLLILLSLGLSFLIIKATTFSKSFNLITDINMSTGVGLIGLIIGGFSIVIASLSSESVYCLILDNSMNKRFSTYKATILYCIEPLFWFCILLVVTFAFKLLYLIYPILNLEYIPSIYLKILVLTILIFLMFISLISLIYFIFNMYNVILSNARFELLKRYAESNNSSIELIIESLENKYNNSIEKEEES